MTPRRGGAKGDKKDREETKRKERSSRKKKCDESYKERKSKSN